MTVAGPVALLAEELDAPIGRVLPELKRGAARSGGSASRRRARRSSISRSGTTTSASCVALGELVEDEKQSAVARDDGGQGRGRLSGGDRSG